MNLITHSKPSITSENIQAVSNQVKSGMHATGSKTKEFEFELSKLIGVKYAKATNSGTTALYLALLALEIKKGDEVILPSYICQSVLSAVNYTKATPVLADIQNDFLLKGFNITSQTIKPKITNKTKAIIVPHMFGVAAQLDKIIKLGIPVIEDCCMSLGAEYKERKLGSIGDIGIFSFYATKVVSTGQGGMIVTKNEKLAEKIKDLTTYDQKDPYTLGYNFNLTDIQSALGISQLKKLNSFIKRRKEIQEKYDEAFRNKFKIMEIPEDSFAFRYLIKLKDKLQRDDLLSKLREKNIGAEIPVFKPLHQLLNLNKKDFPNTELAQDTVLSIPIYPSLTDDEVERVIESVLEF